MGLFVLQESDDLVVLLLLPDFQGLFDTLRLFLLLLDVILDATHPVHLVRNLPLLLFGLPLQTGVHLL